MNRDGSPMEEDLNNRTFNPIVDLYEKKLSSLIGVLSRFIVRRQYGKLIGSSPTTLDLDRAEMLCESIIGDASILIGEERARMLEDELKRITKEHFKEAGKHG